MATTVTVTEQDRVEAENILEQFLTDKVPDASFEKGDAFRDLTIGALAYVFAYMRKENDYLKARQSLLLLGTLTGTDVDDAVDEILSNWFISRKSGAKATGSATIYFTAKVAVTIPTSTIFYKTAALRFIPNSATPLAYSENDLQPVVSSTGVVTAYTLNIPLIAIDSGANYNIEPGGFVDFTSFEGSDKTARVVNNNKFVGGGDIESTEELLARANTAVSVRDLNSARSIDATIRDNFSEVQGVTVIGYGDDEMQRDLAIEGATHTRIHAGGHVDAYIRAPITQEKQFTGVIGGAFPDPREGCYIFRDPTVSTFENVLPGSILTIYNSLAGSEASLYVVKAANKYGMQVSARTKFPLELPAVAESFSDDGALTTGSANFTSGLRMFSSADVGKYVRLYGTMSAANKGTYKIISVVSDYVVQLGTYIGGAPGFTTETTVSWDLVTRCVEYSVGDDPVSYSTKVSRRLSGQFTRTIQNDGRILLPGEPIYRITDVSYAATNGDPYLAGGQTRVFFPNRKNVEPVDPSGIPGNLQYQVVCNNPGEAPSGWQVMEVDVGWPEAKDYFNGKSLRVTYETLSGYDAIWAYMLRGDQRIECGSVIPKGLHPVYLSMNINYRLAKTATAALDHAAAAAALSEYISNFDVVEDIDASDIVAFLRSSYDIIGYIAPLTIDYSLLCPDGRVIHYRTADVVEISDAKLIDPETGLYPHSSKPELLLTDPLALGVSDNTVRYLSSSDLITFTEV